MKHPMTATITPRVRGIHTGEPITAATMNATNHDLGVLGDLSRAAARGTAGISEMMRAAASAGGLERPNGLLLGDTRLDAVVDHLLVEGDCTINLVL